MATTDERPTPVAVQPVEEGEVSAALRLIANEPIDAADIEDVIAILQDRIAALSALTSPKSAVAVQGEPQATDAARRWDVIDSRPAAIIQRGRIVTVLDGFVDTERARRAANKLNNIDALHSKEVSAESCPSRAGGVECERPKGHPGRHAYVDVWPCPACGQTGPFACCGGCYCTCKCRAVAVQTEREQIASILALRARQIRQVLAAGDVPDADDLDGIAATLDMGAAALHTDPPEEGKGLRG